MRIKFKVTSCYSPELLDRNRLSSSKRGLPDISECRGASEHLAVVGGGRSIADHVETLRSWPGELWAINGAFGWCVERGIDATAYTVDAWDELAGYFAGVRKAVLADICDPSLFDALSKAKIELAKVGDEIPGYVTSAGTAPAIALKRGHKRITFFGCESSFVGGTHAYKYDPTDDLVKVRAGDSEFLTSAAFLLQAEFLAKLIRLAPSVFAEQSGGLLSALVANPEYDLLAISRRLYKQIEEEV